MFGPMSQNEIYIMENKHFLLRMYYDFLIEFEMKILKIQMFQFDRQNNRNRNLKNSFHSFSAFPL